MQTVQFIFAGGGSGGHIFPGLAISEALVAATPAGQQAAMTFVISQRPLDQRILADANHVLQGAGGTGGAGRTLRVVTSPAQVLKIAPAGLGVLKFVSGFFKARAEARSMLREAQKAGPVIVLALGGFVAAPVVAAARSLKIPVIMVNLDAVPGKANRLIARRAQAVYSAAAVPAALRTGPAWTMIPPIVRTQVSRSLTRAQAKTALNLDPARPVLMITGGSQGLRTLNEFVLAFAQNSQGQILHTGQWHILHQTGRNLDESARARYAQAGLSATVLPFTADMGLWWAAADFAVCTAGAGTIAEIWTNGVPAMVMPYPFHKDQHQKHNAQPLLDQGATILATDHIDAQANLAAHGATLQHLLTDGGQREQLHVNLEKLGPADGAQRVAKALWDRILGSGAR